MTHITADQKQQIADLRAAGVSFVKIAQQTGIPKGTCKTIFYKDRPPAQPSVKGKNGQFRSAAPRTVPGRRPANGIEAASDKARAAACRARRKERMAQLAGNLQAANDGELANLLVLAVRTGDTNMVKGITSELHTRYCAKT